MPISAERFVNPEKDSPEYRAIKKAVEQEPNVVYIGHVDNRYYYEITSSKKVSPRYPVRFWTDADGETWLECFCLASYPPQHPHTKLEAWAEKICYHSAALLIYLHAQEQNPPENTEDFLPLDS